MTAPVVIILSLSMMVAGACEQQEYWIQPLHEATWESVDGGSGARAPVPRLAAIEPLYSIRRPDHPDWAYRMASPSAVAALGWPTCKVAVADIVDQAIHLFDFEGRYQRSLRLNHGRRSQIRFPAGMGGDARRGLLAVLDGPTDTLISVDLTVEPPLIQRSKPAPLQKLPVPVSQRSGLTDIASPRGKYELAVQNDTQFTRALNEGTRLFLRDGDTLVFARSVDARVFYFVLDQPRRWIPARVQSLPVFFRIDRPEHAIVEDPSVNIPIRMQRHLPVFVAADEDVFVYVQTLAPAERWALVAEQRSTGATARVAIGRVLSLAAADGLVVTLEARPSSSSWSDRRQVLAYRNPLATDIGPCGKDMSEAGA